MFFELLSTHCREGKRWTTPLRALMVWECGVGVAEWQVETELRETNRQAYTNQMECGNQSENCSSEVPWIRQRFLTCRKQRRPYMDLYSSEKSYPQITWGSSGMWASLHVKCFLWLQFKNKVKHQGLGQAFSGMSLLYLTINSWEHHKIIMVSYVWC